MTPTQINKILALDPTSFSFEVNDLAETNPVWAAFFLNARPDTKHFFFPNEIEKIQAGQATAIKAGLTEMKFTESQIAAVEMQLETTH